MAFEEFLPRIQDSADTPSFTLGSALEKLSNGQSVKIVWNKDVGIGGKYNRTGRSEQWPHGRWLLNIDATLTKLGTDANGKHNFQFKGCSKIDNDLYDWSEDADGYRNLLIRTVGTLNKVVNRNKQARSCL